MRTTNRLFFRNDLNTNPVFDAPGLSAGCRRIVDGVDRSLPKAIRRLGESRRRSKVAAETEGRYGASNARTAELTGLDLSAYGYPD